MAKLTRRAILASLGAGLAGAGCVTLPFGRDESGLEGWTRRGGPDANSNRSSTAIATTENSPPVSEEPVRWRRSFDRPIKHSPAVVDDRVYVVAGEDYVNSESDRRKQTGTVAALDSEQGDLDWQQRTAAPPRLAPVVSDGLYVLTGYDHGLGGWENSLRRYDLDGTPAWQTDEVSFYLTLFAVDDRHAYLASRSDIACSNEVFALGLDDGERRWTDSDGDAYRGWRVADVLITQCPPEMTVQDSSDGAVRYTVDADPVHNTDGRPLSARGKLLVDSDGGGLELLGLARGTTYWHTDPPRDESSPPRSGVVHEELVVGQYGMNFFGVSLADGSEQWSTTVPGHATRLLYGAGMVYVGTDMGLLIAIDASTGEVRWWQSFGTDTPGLAISEDTRRPVSVAGLVHVGTSAGELVAMDAETGTERWRWSLGEEAPVLVGVSTTDLVVLARGDDGERFLGIDPTDGTRRWEFEKSMEYTYATVSGETTYLVREDDTVVALGR